MAMNSVTFHSSYRGVISHKSIQACLQHCVEEALAWVNARPSTRVLQISTGCSNLGAHVIVWFEEA